MVIHRGHPSTVTKRPRTKEMWLLHHRPFNNCARQLTLTQELNKSLRRLQVVEHNMMALTAMPEDYALDPDLDFARISKIPNAHRMDMEQFCWMPTFDANKVVSWHCRLCDKIGQPPTVGFLYS